MSRAPQEIAVDRLLLLYLIDRANEKGDLYGITKLMKMIFLSECDMIKDEVKGFNYGFYRWHLGAFTPEIYEDLDHLIENGFVTERFRIELTGDGKRLLSSVNEILKENEHVLRYIDKRVEELARVDACEAMRVAYKTLVRLPPPINQEVEVEAIQLGFPLTFRIDELKADERFIISDEWLETLDILLDKEAYESVMAGIQSARAEGSEKIEL